MKSKVESEPQIARIAPTIKYTVPINSKVFVMTLNLFDVMISLFVKNVKFKVGRDAAKVFLATVYQKHSSLRTRKRMYRG